MLLAYQRKIIQLLMSLLVVVLFSSVCISQLMLLTPDDGTVVTLDILYQMYLSTPTVHVLVTL